MTYVVGFGHEVARDHPQAHGFDPVDIGVDEDLTDRSILFQRNVGRDAGVDQDEVEHALLDLLHDGADVFAGTEGIAFALLGHDITDIDFDGWTSLQSFSNPWDE